LIPEKLDAHAGKKNTEEDADHTPLRDTVGGVFQTRFSLKDLNLGWEIDMTINMLGIDIAKNSFQLHGADSSGKAVHRKRLARCELAAHVANLPTCTVVMEACGGANYWARVFQRSGH
jgi:hypothetical protein